MTNPFQPKTLNVPGLLGDDAINQSLKQFATNQNAVQASAPPPTSAVEMTDRIQKEYLSKPATVMRSAASMLPGPFGQFAGAVGDVVSSDGPPPAGPAPVDPQQHAIDVRSDMLANGLGSVLDEMPRDGSLGTAMGVGAAGMHFLSALGTLTDPADRQAEAEKNAQYAADNVNIAKDTAAMRERLAAIPDDQAEAQGIPRIDIPNSQSMSVPPAEDRKTADAKFLAKREQENKEAIAATKDPSKQPTQTWWLNALQSGAKGVASVPISMARFPAEVQELVRDASGVGALTGTANTRGTARAWIDTVDATLNKLLPGDKTRSKDFATQLASGAGSMLGFMIGGYVAAGAGAPAWSGSAVLGAASQGDQQYQEAEQFGAKGLAKYMSLILGAGIGLSEAIPLDRMFTRADHATGGLVRRMLNTTLASAPEEFVQEFGQAVGQDVVARWLYDEKRKFDLTSYLKQGAVGAITGGLTGAATAALHDSGFSTNPADATPPEQRQQIAQQAIDLLQAQIDKLPGMAEHNAAEAAGTPLSNIAPAQTATAVTQQMAQTPGGMIPVNANGQFEAVHRSSQVLDTIDPALRGTGPYRGRERNRLGPQGNADPNVVDRSYFGVGDPNYVRPKTQPYKLDTDPYHGEGGLGGIAHTVEVDPKTIYNWYEDPLNLKSKLDRSAPASEQVTLYEKLIKDAGFKGAYLSQSDVGQTAIMFDKTTPTKIVDTATGLVQNFKVPDVTKVALAPEDTKPLPGLTSSPGPVPTVVQAGRAYAEARGLPIRRQGEYVTADPERGKRIADAYEKMKHAPNNPKVKAAYQAMADETLAQYQFVKASGLKVEPIEKGMPDPYPEGPKQVLADLQKGHLWFFPTESGFGSSEADVKDNPLLAPTNEKIGDRTLLVNDVFRIVHDFFGHGMEGAGFGARGEENAWQAHMRLYSPAALPAVTSETRGQNSWVNFGPHGEANRANQRDTVYADQKTGIMPDWTWREGVADDGSDSDLFALALPNGDNTDRISTRFPTQARSTEDPLAERLTVDTAAMKSNRAAFDHNMSLVSRYVNLPLDAKTKTPDEIAEQLKDVAKENLRWLYDNVPPEIRDQTKRWYEGARHIVDQWVHRYKLPDSSLAGVLAALSPQKDWYQNVSLAERVLDVTAFKGAEPWSPEMAATAARIFAKPAHAPLLAEIQGKTLNEIDPTRYDLQAMWVRTYDEAHNPRGFSEVSSDGQFVGEPKGNAAWGSLVEIGKAIAVIRDPSYANVSARMGAMHKVRNFFNNILAPMAPKGDVTIDTHAIAAALMRPLSGSSTEVMHNFGSSPMKAKQPADWAGAAKDAGAAGASGTYGLYADAYRELAAELGILPRELQSITWEAVRGMFSAKFKANKKNVAAVDDIWRMHREGDITSDEARQRIEKLAGGVAAPSWFRPGAGRNDEGRSASYARNISGDSVPGWSTGPDASGAGSGAAETVPSGVAPTAVDAAALDENLLASTPGLLNAEQERPDQGIATPTGAAAAQAANADANLSKIRTNFVKLMGLTLRQGRLTLKGGAIGQYDRKQAIARTSTLDDVETIVHEGGHELYFNAGTELQKFIALNDLALMKVADDLYGNGVLTTGMMPKKTHIAEGFAEFFRVYTLNRSYAERHYKPLVDAFDTVLGQDAPHLQTGLASIGQQYAAWLQLPSGQMLKNMIVSGRRDAGLNAALTELREAGFGTWMHEYTRGMVRDSLNRFAPLNDLVTSIANIAEENTGKALDLKRSEDPRALSRLAGNAGARAMVQTTDGVMGYRSTKPISASLRDVLLTYHGKRTDQNLFSVDEALKQDFASYLVALRGIDEFRRKDEGKIKRSPLGKKVKLGDLQQVVSEMEAKHGTAFTEAAKMAHEYNMAQWQKMYDAGLMSEESYLDGLDRQFYVPLQRDMSDRKSSLGASALTGSASAVKRFKGSGRDVIDPMDVMMHKTFALEQIIARNEVFRTLGLLADRVGKVGALVERIPSKTLQASELSVADAAKQLLKDDQISDADAQDLMLILQASADEGNTLKMFHSEAINTMGENIVFGWENGKLAALQLADGDLGADIANTLNGIGQENLPLFTGLITSATTVFRGGIVSWPDFLMANFIKDQFSAFIITDVGFKPFVTGLRGVYDELRQGNWGRQYNAAMGTMGGMNVANLHKSRIDRDINALKRKGYIAKAFTDGGIRGSMQGLARVIELAETGTRIGVYAGAYERARKDGLSEWDAAVEGAYTATDMMDFGLNGSRMLLARRTIPFLNAQLQGLYKMMRTLGADEVRQRKGLNFVLRAYFKSTKNLELSRVEKQAINTGRKAWVKMASLGLISAALHYLFRDDPDYQEAGEYLRTTGWVIPMGGGRLFYIPKPYELAILANFTERALESSEGDSEAMHRFGRGLAMTFLPPVSPPLVKTAVELAANKDFFSDTQIVPDYMQALTPELQFNRYTSTLAKQLGHALNMSPLKIDHVMSSLGASAYRDFTTMYNATDKNRGTMDTTDIPVVRRFIRDSNRGSVAQQDFWRTASTVNGTLRSAEVTYKSFLDAGNEHAADDFLNTLGPDERAYALLTTDFKAEYKRLNPFYRARQLTTITSAMRREMVTDIGLEDTTTKVSDPIKLSAHEKTDLDKALSEYAQREMRNTMVAMNAPGWAGKKMLDTQTTLDLIGRIDPRVGEELQRRIDKAKVYNFDAVKEYWPEVKSRLLVDRENTFLDDILTMAKAAR